MSSFGLVKRVLVWQVVGLQVGITLLMIQGTHSNALAPALVLFSDDLAPVASLLNRHIDYLRSSGYQAVIHISDDPDVVGKNTLMFLHNTTIKGWKMNVGKLQSILNESCAIIMILPEKHIHLASTIKAKCIFYHIKANKQFSLENDVNHIHSIWKDSLDEFRQPIIDFLKVMHFFQDIKVARMMHRRAHPLPYSIIYYPNIGLIEKRNIIGKGSYALVKQGVNLKHEKFAIRICDGLNIEQNELEILNIVGLLKGLVTRRSNYPAKIKARICRYTKKKAYMLLTYVEGEDLDKIIKRSDLDLKQTLIICILIANNLKFIHQNRIIHADLTKYNIRVNINPTDIYDIKLKIIDFNLSSLLSANDDNVKNQYTSKHGWHSPEFCQNEYYSFSTDIYSLGYLFYEMGLEMALYSKMLLEDPLRRPSLDKVIRNLAKALQKLPQDPCSQKIIAEVEKSIGLTPKTYPVDALVKDIKEMKLIDNAPSLLPSFENHKRNTLPSNKFSNSFAYNPKLMSLLLKS